MGIPLKILFVEDSEDDVTLVGHLLRHAGYDVTSLRVDKPAPMALAIQREPWDLILSDYNMPGFSGLDALRLAREHARDVPFIVVSGAIGEEMAATLMREGASDFVGKANLARLVPAIERELREAADRRARRQAEDARAASEARELAALAEIEAARELDRMKSLFIHTISHELRNPLTSVVGYLELLEDDPLGALRPEQLRFVERALTSTKRLAALVDDLLDYARVEGGIFRMRFTDTDLAALVQEVAGEHAAQADAAGVSLVVNGAPGPVMGKIDPKRVAQVLGNLIGNAIKFTPPGGHVRVAVFEAPQRIGFEVADDGPGVVAGDRPKLFRLFSQLEGGLDKGGTGLGLAIAKAIAEAHGGRIGLREPAGGRGSTFFVELPREPVPPKRVTIDHAADREALPDGKGERAGG